MTLEQRCHVALRLRPPTAQEQAEKDPVVWVSEGQLLRVDPSLVVRPPAKLSTQRPCCEFAFNEVYAPSSTLSQLYQRSLRPLVSACQKGVTGLFLIYGQHHPSKREAIFANKSLVELAGLDLLRETVSSLPHLPQQHLRRQFLRVSAFALYCEQLYDLLGEDPRDPLQELPSKRAVSADEGGPQIPMLGALYGGRQELVSSEDELNLLLERVRAGRIRLERAADAANMHIVVQFSVTSISRTATGSDAHSTQVSISSTHRASVDSFSPYSPYQMKSPSSEAVSISQSTLTLLESAGCQGLVHRDARASPRTFKSLDVLWNCLSQGTLKGESKLMPLLKPIERRGPIHCALLVWAAPTLSQVECAFHSVKLAHRALNLQFKVGRASLLQPEKNVIQTETGITKLLESYEKAISSKPRARPRMPLQNVSNSTTYTSSPTPSSPRVEPPQHPPPAQLLREIKLLTQRLQTANRKTFILQSHLQRLTPAPPRELKNALQISNKQMHSDEAGLLELSHAFRWKLMQERPKQGLREEVLCRALRRREAEIAELKEKVLFLFQEATKLQSAQAAQKQREKDELEGKEFLLAKMKESLNFHKERADIMRCKLEFFEALNPSMLSKINDEQIEALENHYSYLQERLKEEKARRIYKTKIDDLKNQIKLLKRSGDQSSSSILQDSILNSSTGSEPYLRLGVVERSFEDSMMSQEEPPQPENAYFQKIFSELFLGGEVSQDKNKLEQTSQKILDDISCLEGAESVIKEEEPIPVTLGSCDEYLKLHFKPSEKLRGMQDKLKKEYATEEPSSNRPVASEQVIALPAESLRSPRLYPREEEKTTSWDMAIEKELRALDFDSRVNKKFTEESGLKLQATRKSPSPIGQRLIPELSTGSSRIEDGYKLPTRSMKILTPSHVSPKVCGGVTIQTTGDRFTLTKKQSGRLPSPMDIKRPSGLKNLILADSFERHRYPLTPTAVPTYKKK